MDVELLGIEMIISSAIKHNGIVYTGKRTPCRHCDIFKDSIPSHKFGELMNAEQGFIDDQGEFLNRTQALHRAFKCNQITLEQYKKLDRLHSEDLWQGNLNA